MASAYASVKPFFIADPAAQQLNRVPNSVDTLEPDDRFVVAVNKLPLVPGVPYHSIIGDRGRGDTPNSSDDVVPYWSSHLDGAFAIENAQSGRLCCGDTSSCRFGRSDGTRGEMNNLAGLQLSQNGIEDGLIVRPHSDD
jgi:hypothetical protein